MSQTLDSIPSLIPLPSHHNNSTTTSTTNNSFTTVTADDKEDLFATLFSPSTPRASPVLAPVQDNPSDDDEFLDFAPVPLPYSRSISHRHSRTLSTDSDFGAFVSVPATEDPLLLDTSSNGGMDDSISSGPSVRISSGFSPLGDLEFFDKFTEGAKVATERKQRDILDELLGHQDDPLYFLNSSSSLPNGQSEVADTTSGVTTPVPSKISPTSEAPERGVGVLGLSQPTLEPPNSFTPSFLYQAPSEPSSSTSSILQMNIDGKPGHDRELEEPQQRETEESSRKSSPRRISSRIPHSRSSPTSSRTPSSSPPLTRSPSLPPTPIKLSDPEIQRAQSFFVPSSVTSTSWVSSLLSRPVMGKGGRLTEGLSQKLSQKRRSSSSEDTSHPSTTHSHLPAHPHNHQNQNYNTYIGVSAPPTLSRAYDRTHTSTSLPLSTAGGGITHGTPFASHTYIPPSGAPGFAGDRQWNTGGFEFDKDVVEKRSVALVGRREGTERVLSGEVADLIRPHFPALSRLPRTWTLLYSLDQHGISLNTLYTHCASHQGGVLIVLRDSNDALFGAWMGEGIRPSKGAYFGSGESFLWKVKMPEKKVKVFKWTGRNDYIALCESDYISFGGGDGNYGLYLDSTLTDGSSAQCLTFDNEPLCSAGPKQGDSITFECVGLEVWGV